VTLTGNSEASIIFYILHQSTQCNVLVTRLTPEQSKNTSPHKCNVSRSCAARSRSGPAHPTRVCRCGALQACALDGQSHTCQKRDRHQQHVGLNLSTSRKNPLQTRCEARSRTRPGWDPALPTGFVTLAGRLTNLKKSVAWPSELPR